MIKKDIKLKKISFEKIKNYNIIIYMKMRYKVAFTLLVILFVRVGYVLYLYNYKYDTWKNEIKVVDIVKIESIKDEGVNYIAKYNNEKFLLYIKDKEKYYSCGDRLEILSSNYEIKKYGNPYEFDYKRYLNSQGLISRIYCIKVLKESKKNSIILNSVQYIRNIISKKLEDKLNSINANLLKSIIYGDDVLLSKELKEKFTNIGLGHILCVSGTHIIFLLKSFEKIVGKEKNRIIKIIMLIYFYIISFFNISLFRALCMFILSNIKTKLNFKDKYALTLIFILIINPYYIFSIGIIFSFLSILGIHIFSSILNSWLSIKIGDKSKINKYIIDNISLSISSQILILPFSIYYFQKICLISIISNLVLSFSLSILMLLGFSLFTLFFIPIISDVLIFICNFILNLIVAQVEFIDSINYFNIQLPKINIAIFISYYIVILLYLYGKKLCLISWKYRKVIKKLKCVVIIICIIYPIIWYINSTYFDSYVIYFNVGQGNMALIHEGRTNIIVDIGSKVEANAGNIICNFLRCKNINSIDAVFITHMHNDHMNGLQELIENFKVQRVAFSIPVEKSEEYEILRKKLKDKKIAIVNVEEQDEISINKVIVNVLSPPKGEYILDDDMLNANSNAFLVSINENNYLFMGDATKNTEKYILNKYLLCKYGNDKKISEIKDKIKNLRALQVSHHGSKTSTYEKFICNINNCYAIISADKEVYGHPDEEVVELLKKYNFNIFITQKVGAITI